MRGFVGILAILLALAAIIMELPAEKVCAINAPGSELCRDLAGTGLFISVLMHGTALFKNCCGELVSRRGLIRFHHTIWPLHLPYVD